MLPKVIYMRRYGILLHIVPWLFNGPGAAIDLAQ